MTRRTYRLVHEEARRRAAADCMTAPDGFVVTVAEPKKSRIQEEKYHAMFGDISRQFMFRGVKLDEENTKRVMVSAFKEDTKHDEDFRELWKQVGEMQMTVGLRGEVVVFGDQTRKFPKKLASALIEWLYVFGAENGIRWTDPAKRKSRKTERIDPDTGEIHMEGATA